MTILPQKYYLNQDVVGLSKDLIGKFLFTRDENGIVAGGMITETEAYQGPEDRACHAYNNRRTKRTEVMFHAGGICYVYLCYGIHYLLNIVTNDIDIPHAILIRAIKPEAGLEAICQRRKKEKITPNLTVGPGSVAQALGISMRYNGASLQGPTIWIEDRSYIFSDQDIQCSPRIGIDYAGEDALLPWRFTLTQFTR